MKPFPTIKGKGYLKNTVTKRLDTSIVPPSTPLDDRRDRINPLRHLLRSFIDTTVHAPLFLIGPLGETVTRQCNSMANNYPPSCS